MASSFRSLRSPQLFARYLQDRSDDDHADLTDWIPHDVQGRLHLMPHDDALCAGRSCLSLRSAAAMTTLLD
jgi:hypothetical protein